MATIMVVTELTLIVYQTPIAFAAAKTRDFGPLLDYYKYDLQTGILCTMQDIVQALMK
ncbi:hypothetical protein V5O48_006579 [Marasmius crinis-equi]|uniref:Uncharacterized protein n=1 Tax=Marasmius crinis-equi TaxID=585013 RepID=A0ABR3FJ35_9AGAR